MNWLLLRSAPGEPAFNMALDEALLESAATHAAPVLRLYSWAVPAATFGYFQHHEEIAAVTPLRPLIRRCTGGGLVPHAADWTYSLAFPPAHEWFALSATDSYLRVHDWLRLAFARLGTATELAPCCVREVAGQCFAGHEKYDLLWNGRKIAGAAQRRNKLGLLIQGSLQPPPGIARSDFENALTAAASEEWRVQWQELSPSPELLARAASLAAAKYGRDDYNRQR